MGYFIHLDGVPVLCQRVRIRIILSLSFALSGMLSENIRVTAAEGQAGRWQAQAEQPAYDFSSCQRLKKLTTHDIYRFTQGDVPLVVKLFAPQSLLNYQQELSCLRCASHPALLRVLHNRSAQDPLSPQPLSRSHLIVMAQATRGDLNDYLPRYGKMTEKVARTCFRQLAEGLQGLTQLQPPLAHPNLLASNLLLTQDGQLKLCGWSELPSKPLDELLKENVFGCGEILVCMLTSFMPFYKKNSPTDTYFKFLTADHIHKFWQELQKKIQKMDKKFSFSSEVKDLVEAIFLKKINKIAEVVAHQWTKGEVYSQEELVRVLEDNEKAKNEKIAAKRKSEAANEEKKKMALHEYHLSCGLHRSSALEENQQFLKDCEQNVIREEQLPVPVSKPLSCLKISASPNFVIASLKDFLRRQNGKSSVVLCQQFLLSNHKVMRVSNYVKVQLQFSVAVLQQEQEQLLEPEQELVSLSLKISFSRYGKEVFADVEVLQSNFNTYYTNLALAFIEDRIQKRKEIYQ